MQEPLAADLRLVIAAMEINKELEQIGDLSVSITRNALELIRVTAVPGVVDIPRISSEAAEMVSDAVRSFVGRDTALAYKVLKSDDTVDNLRTKSHDKLIGLTRQSPQQIPEFLHLFAVVLSLERIADRAPNIAEDVLFLVKNERCSASISLVVPCGSS